jgi:hypothetical protein
MTKRLYYNSVAATGDPRKGMGYGKSQKIPSFGTGLGSERSMGSAETGIYSEPYEEDEEYEDEFIDQDDTDKFVKKINKNIINPDPAFWPRADRSSLGSAGAGWMAGFGGMGVAEGMIPVPKGQRLPKASAGIAPFPHSVLYPGGFDGPPLGSGGASQAFKTTGPAFKSGTQYGSSRAPTGVMSDDDTDIMISGFKDILDLDPSERSIIKQKLRIMKLLNRIDEIESQTGM